MRSPRLKSNSMTKPVKLLALMLMTSLMSTNALSAPVIDPNAKIKPMEYSDLVLFKPAGLVSDSDLLNACDKALNAKIQEASLCGLGVQLRQSELERVTKENAQLRERGQAWYNNPFVFAAIGVIVGAYAGARAVR